MKLSNRLKICADMIQSGSNVVDVGTDHAYLPIYLALKNKTKNLLACDIFEKPLKTAQKNIRKFGLENKIKTRLSDGLEKIKEYEADTVVIAGMGGETIIKILKNCKWKSKENKIFVLNPMTSEFELRKFLVQNSYKIKQETAVFCSKKIYTVMKVIFSGEQKKAEDLYFYIGELIKNINENTKIYINKQIRNLKNKKKGANIRENSDLAIYYNIIIEKLEELIKSG